MELHAIMTLDLHDAVGAQYKEFYKVLEDPDTGEWTKKEGTSTTLTKTFQSSFSPKTALAHTKILLKVAASAAKVYSCNITIQIGNEEEKQFSQNWFSD